MYTTRGIISASLSYSERKRLRYGPVA